MSERTLTDQDVAAIVAAIQADASCDICSFTEEEVQFVRDWLDTAKIAKSELIKLIVRGAVILVMLVSGVITAYKMGWFK